MSRNSAKKCLAAAAALLMLASLTACKPDNVFFEVTNGSGGKVHDVKVTYPDDKLTFGSLDDSTITGTYRHFDGPGDLAVSFSTEDGQSHSSSGPQVSGNEKGEVKINISGSSASFETSFEQRQ
jgi:hypothetical protein